MKQLITLLIILMTGLSSFSQTLNFSGQVKDSETKTNIAYCSVLMMQNDSVKHFAITDENGKFNIPSKKGKYNVVFRFLGYNPDTTLVEITNRNKSIGAIYLETDSKLLNEIVVKGEAKKNLIDRDETIVTKKLRAGTATTSDLLDKVNGVTFDRYNDQIKVDNESNVLILLNGLEKDQTFIKNVDPNRIAKIEVIRDPSGKYGLEGYSSIINIKLKKNYIGQEAFGTLQNLMDFDTPNKDYFFPQNNINASYNFSRKSLNIYSQLWLNRTKIALSQNTIKEYKNNLSTIQKSKDGTDNFSIDELSTYLTIGADYQLNPKHTFSFEGQYGGNPKDNQKTNFLIQNKDNEEIISEENYQSNTVKPSTNFSGSLFYLGNLSEEKSLNADFTLGGSMFKNNTDFQYDNLAKVTNDMKENSVYTKLNVEWNHVINQKFSYQIGYGNTWKKTDNKLYTFDSQNPTNEYQLTDFRNRAFAYGTYRISKKITLKTGLAVENSLPKLDDQKQNYWIYKPHLDIHYKAFNWVNFKLKYRTNENYPSLYEANPVEVAIDNYTVQKGNPNLVPSTTHKASLTANFLHGLASVSLFYHFSDNYISPVGNLRENGIFEYSYDNLGGYKHKGIKFNFTIPFSEKIILQNSAKIYNSEMNYKNNTNNFSDWRAESQLMYVDQKTGMWAGLMLQKSNTKIITPQGYNQGNNDFWALIAQRPFLKKKLSVMILYMLPINWIADYSQNKYIKTPSYTQRDNVDLSILKNIFILKISYRFHKGKSIKTIKKNVERETSKKKGGIF